MCINHMLVRALACDLFELGSPNWDQGCKNNLAKMPIICGKIDLDPGGQIELQSQNLPKFELVHVITHHQLKLEPSYLEKKDAKHIC